MKRNYFFSSVLLSFALLTGSLRATSQDIKIITSFLLQEFGGVAEAKAKLSDAHFIMGDSNITF